MANRVSVQYCSTFATFASLLCCNTAVVCYIKVCYKRCWQNGCQEQLLTSSILHTITVLCAEEAKLQQANNVMLLVSIVITRSHIKHIAYKYKYEYEYNYK